MSDEMIESNEVETAVEPVAVAKKWHPRWYLQTKIGDTFVEQEFELKRDLEKALKLCSSDDVLSIIRGKKMPFKVEQKFTV